MDKSRKHWMVMAMMCCLIASFSIPINSSSVFLSPVSQELGFQRGDFSFHSTLTLMVSAFVSLRVGKLMERFHLKALLIAGAVLTAVPHILMGFSNQLWHFNALGSLRGVGAGLISMVPIAIIINQWFDKHHGLVTSIVLSASGVAGALFTPLLAAFIERFGWQNTYFISGGMIAFLILIGILYPFSAKPQDDGLLPYGDKEMKDNENTVVINDGASLFNKWGFGLIMLIGILHTSVSGILQHFPGYAESIGHPATMGAMMLSASMIGSIFFKLGAGVLSDRFNAFITNISLILISAIASILLLVSPHPVILLVGGFLFGSVYAVPGVGLTLLTRSVLGNQHFNRVFPMVSFALSMGGAFAISAVGYVYDFAGSYIPAISMVILVNLVNSALLILLNRQVKTQAIMQKQSQNYQNHNSFSQ